MGFAVTFCALDFSVVIYVLAQVFKHHIFVLVVLSGLVLQLLTWLFLSFVHHL